MITTLDLINSTVTSFPILHFESHSGELNEDMTATNSFLLYVFECGTIRGISPIETVHND